TGSDAVAVSRAWAVVVRASGAADVWAAVGNPDALLPLNAEMRSWTALAEAVERATKWIVATPLAGIPAANLNDPLSPPGPQLLDGLPALLPPALQEAQAATAAALATEGTPRALAEAIARLGRLAELFEIAHVAAELNAPRRLAAEVYYAGG